MIDDGGYQPVALPLLLSQATNLKLQMEWSRGGSVNDAEKFENMDRQAKAKDALKDAPKEPTSSRMENVDDDELALEVVLPPPIGDLSYLLQAVALQRQDADLIVERVWPDNIHYYPGDQAQIEVRVRNASKRSHEGRLTVDLIHGLDSRTEIFKEDIAVPAGKALEKRLSCVPPALYGHEIRATVTEGGKSHGASEYFGVSENLFELSISGSPPGGVSYDMGGLHQSLTISDERLMQQSRAKAMELRRDYINHVEYFSWAPDDFFNLAPKEDYWWSGTHVYIKVKREMKALIKAMQEQGIKVLTYAQPYPVGLDTQEELRRDPAIFAYQKHGDPMVGYDYYRMKSRTRIDMGRRGGEIKGALSLIQMPAVDRGLDAIIASQKMFGWDGVRWDNRYYRADNWPNNEGKYFPMAGKTHRDYSVRNLKHIKKRLWDELGRRFLISHNNGYKWRQSRGAAWDETVKDGLMCMDEESCNIGGPWRHFFNYGLTGNRVCHQLGGHYQLFPPGRGPTIPSDVIYYLVACLATGSHPVVTNVEDHPAGHYGRFLTRYSAFFFAKDIKPLEKADQVISFPGLEENALWWKPYANRLHLAGKEYLLFPLVVPPVASINKDLLAPIPSALSGASALVGKDHLRQGDRAMLLTCEPYPELHRLKAVPESGGTRLALPLINHFALLVLEREARP